VNSLVKTNLANLITAVVLLFSWLAIVFLLRDLFYLSFGLIILAFVLDAVDGYIARVLKIENKFGRAIDGYVDVINYLVYPALVFFVFFQMKNVFSLFLIFVFLAAGIFRLARFEIKGIQTENSRMYYQGLPVFFSPVLILIFLLLFRFLDETSFIILASLALLVESFLMVLTFKFPKPKNVFLVVFFALILSLVFFIIQFSFPK